MTNKKGITQRVEKVTPAIATQWLNKNHTNRSLRANVVEQYASDMAKKKWTHCHTPIGFYEDGELADGQHRLWAVIESKTTQTFLITRGLSRKDGLNIDTGVARSVIDAGKISGLNPSLTPRLISITRSIEHGTSGHARSSHSEKLRLIEKHKEAGEWVAKHGPHGRNLANGAVLGAVGRAYYHIADKDKLARFCEVLSDGFSNGTHESAAVALRNYLQSCNNSGTSALWRDTFLKVQNAIKYFVSGKPLTIIKTVKDEAYPLK